MNYEKPRKKLKGIFCDNYTLRMYMAILEIQDIIEKIIKQPNLFLQITMSKLMSESNLGRDSCRLLFSALPRKWCEMSHSSFSRCNHKKVCFV